ncbi:hypothetical protein PMIN01_12575 [Paraphaeosphaeria minitans]|uniref:Uncharacterized protein n=1 Tax=Paraphaeosphaeria minitans TaxID=565426 RepID=A0A9P6G5Y2_9PLEO|nr:hypothetical protein PMIN01_12575 [Paraphaeosphaeria minitans]
MRACYPPVWLLAEQSTPMQSRANRSRVSIAFSDCCDGSLCGDIHVCLVTPFNNHASYLYGWYNTVRGCFQGSQRPDNAIGSMKAAGQRHGTDANIVRRRNLTDSHVLTRHLWIIAYPVRAYASLFAADGNTETSPTQVRTLEISASVEV